MASARLAIVERIEQNLKQISKAKDYNLNYDEIEYADSTPTEYGQSGLYWRDGKGEGEFGKTQDSQLWIEVDAVLPQISGEPAHKLGTLAIEDLERCFKSIGVCGAMSVKWKSEKWVETEGRTVCRVYYRVLVKYQNYI